MELWCLQDTKPCQMSNMHLLTLAVWKTSLGTPPPSSSSPHDQKGIPMACSGLVSDLSVVPGTQGSAVTGEVWPESAASRGIRRPQIGGRSRRALAGPCQLRSLTLPVAELGLGYASEETVIFRYCAGSCPRGARTQHGLTLARLRGQGRAHGGPCCQPTRYVDVAFLDDRHRWQLLPQFSAAACNCGG